MKISFAGFVLAAAITVSSASFGKDGGKTNPSLETVKDKGFETAMYKIWNTNQFRLLVSKHREGLLRIALKDKAGVVYYAEKLAGQKHGTNPSLYSLVFDMDKLTDGDYYFEIYHKGGREIKTFSIESKNIRHFSLQ